MTLRHIEGYCEKRRMLIDILENLKPDEQHPLNNLSKRCLYSCNGFDYECLDYDGSKINFKEAKNEDRG